MDESQVGEGHGKAEEAGGQAKPERAQAVDAAVVGERQNVSTVLNKLTADASFEELARCIPEVRAMVGMDQLSDYHSLTLDEHAKEVARRLATDPFVAGHFKKDIIFLAGELHDLGKTSPDGRQIHPKDPGKRQYVGHERESARMISELLPKYFVGISEEDRALIVGLAALHASALNLAKNFTDNNQPRGKRLGSYGDFIARVEEIAINIPLEEKMKIIFALNRADKLAGFNDQSDKGDPKVQQIMEKATEQVRGLDELEKVFPVLLQAVRNKRNGDQKAGIVFEGGEYRLIGAEVNMLETSERVSEMDLEKIRGLTEAESERVAKLGEWPEYKMPYAKESIAGRIPRPGDENAQGFDAGLACALDMIPREMQRLSAVLHGNYTPGAVEQVRREVGALDQNPDSETAWWLAACNCCTEGGINPEKFREQLRRFEELSADETARLAAAKAEYGKMTSTFTTDQYGFPFGTADGCIQGAYLAGYLAGAWCNPEDGSYFIGTYLPSLGLENFEWSKEVDGKNRPKFGPVHGSKQFVKCANEKEFKDAIEIVKQHLRMN